VSKRWSRTIYENLCVSHHGLGGVSARMGEDSQKIADFSGLSGAGSLLAVEPV